MRRFKVRILLYWFLLLSCLYVLPFWSYLASRGAVPAFVCWYAFLIDFVFVMFFWPSWFVPNLANVTCNFFLCHLSVFVVCLYSVSSDCVSCRTVRDTFQHSIQHGEPRLWLVVGLRSGCAYAPLRMLAARGLSIGAFFGRLGPSNRIMTSEAS